MKSRKYLVYDVFTGTRDWRAIRSPSCSTARVSTATAMQAIAREFNLSESVFILPPENPLHRARVRIFTPVLRNAVCRPSDRRLGGRARRTGDDDGAAGMFVLEENIGPVRCAVTKDGGATFAEFDLPQLPERLALVADAAALGGGARARPARGRLREPSSRPVVGGRALCDRARRGSRGSGEGALRQPGLAGARAAQGRTALVASAYVYCRESVHHDSAFHARMFVPGNPILRGSGDRLGGCRIRRRDPRISTGRWTASSATGSSRASRWAARRASGWRSMSRDGKPTGARIGGHAVKVAEGVLHV